MVDPTSGASTGLRRHQFGIPCRGPQTTSREMDVKLIQAAYQGGGYGVHIYLSAAVLKFNVVQNPLGGQVTLRTVGIHLALLANFVTILTRLDRRQ